MPKILVIADDLTGAAEIGGIAYKAGFSVRIILDCLPETHFGEDVIIIETNSRKLSADQAYLKILGVLKSINFAGYDLIFKKVDSLLRGNISSEMRAIFTGSAMKSALLIPANPTKNRIIKNGKYYIDNIPINETQFKFDPEYPRRWKTVKKLISYGSEKPINKPVLLEEHICPIAIPDIGSIIDIEVFANQKNNVNQLLAGGADFFRTLLTIRLGRTFQTIPTDVEFLGNKLIIIGSSSNVSKQTLVTLSKKKYKIFNLPSPVNSNGNSFFNWKNEVKTEFEKGENIAIAPPVKFVREHSRRLQITDMIVELACQIIKSSTSDLPILIEGGDTASAFFRAMKWCDLNVCANFNDGVVMLVDKKSNRKVTMKPGSYKWPTVITNNI